MMTRTITLLSLVTTLAATSCFAGKSRLIHNPNQPRFHVPKNNHAYSKKAVLKQIKNQKKLEQIQEHNHPTHDQVTIGLKLALVSHVIRNNN